MVTRRELELYVNEIERRLKSIGVLEEYESLRLESIKPDRERLYRILLCDNREGGCVPVSGFYNMREIEAAVITTTHIVRIIQSHIKQK